MNAALILAGGVGARMGESIPKQFIEVYGKPVIISGDYFKIDLAALEESDYSASPMNTRLKPMQCTSITLTSKDGYKYVFGGDLSSVEYTISLLNGNDWDVQYPPVISSWHLKKVIAPNRRQILFYYKQPVDNIGYIRADSLLELNEYKDLFATKDFFSYQVDQSGLPTVQPVQTIKMNMTRICVLDSIVVSDAQPLRVHFFNRADRKSLYKHSHYGIGDKPCMLDSIYILSDARILRKVSLSYEYKDYDNVHYWRYLKDVYISGVGAYTLSYNHEAGMYQSLLASTGPAYDAIVDYYGYSVSHPLGGLLTRIDFPTGGRQEFSYEGLMDLIGGRKTDPKEGSYTTYLFEKGLDKILKKIGEESTEVIVAAKSAETTGDNRETVYEIADLAYHVMVLMQETGISLEDIHRELASRHVIDKKVKQEKMV